MKVKEAKHNTCCAWKGRHDIGESVLTFAIRPGEKVSAVSCHNSCDAMRQKICSSRARKKNNLLPHSLRKNQQYNRGLWILDECPSFSCVCFLLCYLSEPILVVVAGPTNRRWGELTEFRRRGAASPSTHCAWVNIKPHYWGVIENLCTFCSI